MAHKIIVIGGINADIAGIPSSKIIMNDSNPGKISVSAGGVGRNISENLQRLGAEVSFVTAFADDFFAPLLISNCSFLGIDISLSKSVSNSKSSAYLYVQDNYGDMVVAINDMDIIKEITPEYISTILDKINTYDGCVIDANLTKEAIDYICDNVTIPIYADPVSSIKAVKLKDKLDKLTAIKPNELEYSVLGKGKCKAFVSLGKNGMRAIWGNQDVHIPAKMIDVKSTNGAGDAAMAAIIIGDLNGLSLEDTAHFAVEEGTKRAAHY